MDYHGRRNRRGRERRTRQSIAPQSFIVPNPQKRWSVMDGLSSIFIITSLLAIIYLMLDYHCTACSSSKCDLTNITRNIDDIANNISIMKESYNDLEMKVIKFSHELPKIEGQIEILESIANTIGCGDFQRSKQDGSLRNCKVDCSPKCIRHEERNANEAGAQNITNRFLKKQIKAEQD